MPHLRFCSCLVLAFAAACGPDAATAPDAAMPPSPPPPPPPSKIPSSAAGSFALTSELTLAIPDEAQPMIATLTAATDGPDDPTRYLVDRIEAHPRVQVREGTAVSDFLEPQLFQRGECRRHEALTAPVLAERHDQLRHL